MNNVVFRGLIALVAVAICSSTSSAQTNVRVRRYYHSGCTSPCAPLPYCETSHGSLALIQILVDSCTRRINIYTTDGTSTIPNININQPAPSYPTYLEVFIGEGDFPYGGEDMTIAAGNMGWLSIPDSTMRGVTRFAGQIGGNQTGQVWVGKLYRFDVEGAIQAALAADLPGGAGLFQVNAGSTTSNGVITCMAGTIDYVDVVGDAVGNIFASAGGITDVVAANARGTVSARDFIGSITASGAIATSGGGAITISTSGADAPIGVVQGTSINATMTAGSVGDRGIVERVRATSGNLAGSITAESLSDPSAGVPVIDVAGSLTGSITLVSSGLDGQVNVNSANSTGTWTGTVSVGGTSLSPLPHYTNLSAGLGGGSVGHVPYDLHDLDCNPDNGASIAAAPITNVVITHYGPVWWDDEEAPFIIDWSEAGQGEWETLPQQDFTYTRGSNHRDVTITAETEFDFKEGFDYRIRPNTGVLKCELGGNTINVVGYTYILHGS